MIVVFFYYIFHPFPIINFVSLFPPSYLQMSLFIVLLDGVLSCTGIVSTHNTCYASSDIECCQRVCSVYQGRTYN